MFRFDSSTRKQDRLREPAKQPVFGVKKPTPRLESAFIFPAVERPKGLIFDDRTKGEKPVSKKP